LFFTSHLSASISDIRRSETRDRSNAFPLIV